MGPKASKEIKYLSYLTNFRESKSEENSPRIPSKGKGQPTTHNGAYIGISGFQVEKNDKSPSSGKNLKPQRSERNLQDPVQEEMSTAVDFT